MDGCTPRFVALQPDERLTALLWDYKRRTRELVGDQLYLDDPPHLTVYLAVYLAGTSLTPLLRPVPAPRVRLLGWHVFEADALTGLHTLVCDIHPDDQQALREVQDRVVEAVASHRDHAATLARFGPRLGQLGEEQAGNVHRHGFPYLGDGWIPHFTVASIRPADWDRVYSALRDDPPVGEFTCTALKEYELVEGKPRLVGTIKFP